MPILVACLVGCAQIGGGVAPAGTTATPAPTPTPRASPWLGVHMHPTWDRAEDAARLAAARSAGIELVRIGVSWRLLEPEQGRWNEGWYLRELEWLVAQAQKNDLELLFMLAETPCWASSDPAKDCAAKPYPNFQFWCPASDLAGYARAFAFLVERFGPRVQAWEVWNEPNVDHFWCGAADPVAYAEMLRQTYAAAKAADPDAVVLGGSLAGADLDYLRALYAAGSSGAYDALALHPYSGTHPPEACSNPRWSYACGVDAVRQVMHEHGEDCPIWFTEMGWSSYEGTGGVGENHQALYATRALEGMSNWDDVPAFVWYNLVDRSADGAQDREGYFGLIDAGLQPKPVADSFRRWAEQRPRP